MDLIACQASEVVSDDHSDFLTGAVSSHAEDRLAREEAEATFINHP